MTLIDIHLLSIDLPFTPKESKGRMSKDFDTYSHMFNYFPFKPKSKDT